MFMIAIGYTEYECIFLMNKFKVMHGRINISEIFAEFVYYFNAFVFYLLLHCTNIHFNNYKILIINII